MPYEELADFKGFWAEPVMFIVMDVDKGRILLSHETRQIVINDLLGFAALLKKTILNFTEAYSAHQNGPEAKAW